MESTEATTVARLISCIRQLGVARSSQLQAALGCSQPTVSRLLSRAGGEVLTLGAGKRSRYALPQSILGAAASQPLHWIHADGRVERVGSLSLLQGDRVHLQVDGDDWLTEGRLPWPLAPLRAEGFLGRALAQRLQLHGLAADPGDWSLPQQLFAALQQPDAPGALVLGEARHVDLPVVDDGALDERAAAAASSLPAGSSAGGEQAKFLARDAQGQAVLVKFSPPRGTPFGERWHDLLLLEQLALQLLAEHGVHAAVPRLVTAGRRTHLVSPRFDRVGRSGRRHVVSLGAVHDAFVPVARQHWAASCEALVAQRRLPREAAAQAQALRSFGRLIGNSDMHFGNLSLWVEREEMARGRFALAPLYDMLPMRWRPDPGSGALDLLPFTPEPVDLQSAAQPLALNFWQRAAHASGLSPGFRQLASQMIDRLQAR